MNAIVIGRSNLVGRPLLLSSVRYDVIGVMPRSFVFRNRDVDYWVPMALPPAQANIRTSHFLNVVARLRPGISVVAAADDMTRVADMVREEFPDTNRGIGATVVPLREDLVGETRTELLVLMAAAACAAQRKCRRPCGALSSWPVARVSRKRF